MTFRFLLDDVSISIVDQLDSISPVLYADHFVQLNEIQFKIHVPEVANIIAKEGKSIEIEVLGKLNIKTIELYLNGSILGAILHQREVLSFHGSSVSFQGKGILFCGDSGGGKSTITYGLTRESKFEFLTDDITPILFEENTALINPISERMKLWSDTLEKFNVDSSELEIVRTDTNKYFIEFDGSNKKTELSTIFFLQVSDSPTISINEILGAEKIQYLLKSVYRYDFLKGMKSTEIAFFKKHANLAASVKCYELNRPLNSDIAQVINEIRTIIE